MLSFYFLFFFFIQASTKQIGCTPNTTFISGDIKILQTNFTFDQCECYHLSHNYSGFIYFTQNQTCELSQNFTTDFELMVKTQTRFCFSSQPTSKNEKLPLLTICYLLKEVVLD